MTNLTRLKSLPLPSSSSSQINPDNNRTRNAFTPVSVRNLRSKVLENSLCPDTASWRSQQQPEIDSSMRILMNHYSWYTAFNSLFSYSWAMEKDAEYHQAKTLVETALLINAISRCTGWHDENDCRALAKNVLMAFNFEDIDFAALTGSIVDVITSHPGKTIHELIDGPLTRRLRHNARADHKNKQRAFSYQSSPHPIALITELLLHFSGPFMMYGKASVEVSYKVKAMLADIDDDIRYLASSNPENLRLKEREINKQIKLMRCWQATLSAPGCTETLKRFHDAKEQLHDFRSLRRTALKKHQNIRRWDPSPNQASDSAASRHASSLLATATGVGSLMMQPVFSGGLPATGGLRPSGIWADLYRAGVWGAEKALTMFTSHPYSAVTAGYWLLNKAKHSLDRLTQPAGFHSLISEQSAPSYTAGLQANQGSADLVETAHQMHDLTGDILIHTENNLRLPHAEQIILPEKLSLRYARHVRSLQDNVTADSSYSMAATISAPVLAGSASEDSDEVTVELMNSEDEMATRLAGWLKSSVDEFQGNLNMDELTRFYQLIKSQKEPQFYKDYRDNINQLQLRLARILNLEDDRGMLISDFTTVFIHTQNPPQDFRANGGGDKGRRGITIDSQGRPRVIQPSVSSGSLWDFICTGVSDSVTGDGPDAKIFRDKTWLTMPGRNDQFSGEENILRLLKQIRKFDMGKQLRRWGAEYTGDGAKANRTGIWASLPQYNKKNFEIALFDAMRKGQITRLVFESLKRIRRENTSGLTSTIRWHQFYLFERPAAPRNSFEDAVEDVLAMPMRYIDCNGGMARPDQIAGWLLHVNGSSGSDYCSYIPGRIGREFMMHASQKEAERELTEEINNELEKKAITGHWIFNAISLETLHEFRMVFKDSAIDEENLNPLAKILYYFINSQKELSFAVKTTNSCNNSEYPFIDNVVFLNVERFKSPMNHIQTSREASLQIYYRRVLASVSETVEFITMPLPGKVSFPLRDWLFRILIVTNVITLPSDLAIDPPAALSTLTDILDLTIERKSQGYLSKQIKSRLKGWRVSADNRGQPAVWDPAASAVYTFSYMPSSALLSEDGIWRTADGEQYVYIDTSSGVRVSQVKCQDEHLVIIHSELNGVEPVLKRVSIDRWALDLDGHYSQDIMKLIRASVVNTAVSSLSDRQLELMMRSSDTTLEALMAYWRCDTLAPHALLVALRELRSRKVALEIGEYVSSGQLERLPEQAEPLVLARLASMFNVRVLVKDNDSGKEVIYIPNGGEAYTMFNIVRHGLWSYSWSEGSDEITDSSPFKIFAGREHRLLLKRPKVQKASAESIEQRAHKHIGRWFSAIDHQELVYDALINARRLPQEMNPHVRELMPQKVMASEPDRKSQLVRCIFNNLDIKEISRYSDVITASTRSEKGLKIAGEAWQHLTKLSDERRLTSARVILSEEASFGLTTDAENLFYSTLVALDSFPVDTAVMVSDAGKSGSGEFWGPPDAGRIIQIIRTRSAAGFNRYHATRPMADSEVNFKTINELERTFAQSFPDAESVIGDLHVHLMDRKKLLAPLYLNMVSPEDAPILQSFHPQPSLSESLTGPDSDNLYHSASGQSYIKTPNHYWPVKYLDKTFNTRVGQLYLIDLHSGGSAVAQAINVSGKWMVIDTAHYFTSEGHARRVIQRYAVSDPELLAELINNSWSEHNPAQLHWINGQSYVRHILTYPKKQSSEVVFNRVLKQHEGELEILKSDKTAGVNTGHFMFKVDNHWKLVAGLKGGMPVELNGKPDEYFMSNADAKLLYSFDGSALIPGAPALTIPEAEETRGRLYRIQYTLFQRAMKLVMMLERKPATWSYLTSVSGQLTVDDMIKQTYQHARGMIVGENHTSVSAKQFFYQYMAAFKAAGVSTIYLEGITTELWADDLHLYNAMPPGTPLPEALRTGLGIADRNYNHQSQSFNRVKLIETAHAYGIRIVGIDALASDIGMAVQSDYIERLILFNYLAANIIQHDQKEYPGNWVAFTGLAHTSEVNGTPGLSEILRVPSVRVSDQVQGDTRVTLGESFFIYFDEEESMIVRHDAHIRMTTGISLERHPPFLAQDEFFISPLGVISYRRSLQPDVIQTTPIIWHPGSGHFSLQDCPDAWGHVKGKRFRTTRDFIKAMEMDSMTFTNGPGVLHIGSSASSDQHKVKLESFL